MAEPQEFNSLDELFRKTFEDLPDTPAASGWDTPSPRVWDQVQVHLKPPRSGWSAQTILLVSGLAITLMLGLYWALSAPATPQTNSAPQINAVQEAPAPSTVSPENMETAPAAAPETVRTKPSATTAAPHNPAPRFKQSDQASIPATTRPESSQPASWTERLAEEPGRHRPNGSAAPLPGSHPASPNTTVLRQQEFWRKAPWAKPLAPLPGVWEKPVLRPLPEGLK